jgi:hypothetical protein
VTDPAADAARATAVMLAPAYGPSLPADVEAALAARHAEQRVNRFLDPISLATLIVSVATLAWTIYNDQRERSAEPPPPARLARQVRITLREQDTVLPEGTERIIELITTEITRHASSGE